MFTKLFPLVIFVNLAIKVLGWPGDAVWAIAALVICIDAFIAGLMPR